MERMKIDEIVSRDSGVNDVSIPCDTKENPSEGEWAGTDAMHDMQAEAETARERVTFLKHEIADAEADLAEIEAALQLETNEQLVIATIKAEAEAARCQDALKQAELATETDALTGLPNRTVLLDRLAIALANANRHGHRVGLLFVDLDNFKDVNDSGGHAAGDDVIKRVASALTSSVRAIDTVSRHGGDEFLILLSEIALEEDALLVSEKIAGALSKILVGPKDEPLSASVGISVYPDHGTDARTLIERADKAMYSAKRNGASSTVFTP